MQFRDYVWYWYTTYRQHRQQKTTQAVFISMIQGHIMTSSLGQMELESVRTADVQAFLLHERMKGCRVHFKTYDKRDTPLSAFTVTRLRQLLIAVFRQAMKEGIVQQNAAEGTEPVPLPWRDAPVFTAENQRKFLMATRNHRFHLAYLLLFFTGCRRGEILGLTWDAIDFRRNTMRITKSLLIEDGKIVLKERTKTRASMRVIPFPKEIRILLQEHKQKQKEESRAAGWKNLDNLVFTNKDGSPHSPIYFSRNFKNAIRRIEGLPDGLHVHSCRHTWATNMIQCGNAITDVQYLGGWSRPDTLLNIYAHTVKDSQRKAMKKLFQTLQ